MEYDIVDVPESSVTVWMIERIVNGNAHWWSREPDQYTPWDDEDRWTTDPNKARKYRTQKAAEFVMGEEMKDCVATGHIWMEATDEQTA
jgi:hypothetical protein